MRAKMLSNVLVTRITTRTFHYAKSPSSRMFFDAPLFKTKLIGSSRAPKARAKKNLKSLRTCRWESNVLYNAFLRSEH